MTVRTVSARGCEGDQDRDGDRQADGIEGTLTPALPSASIDKRARQPCQAFPRCSVGQPTVYPCAGTHFSKNFLFMLRLLVNFFVTAGRRVVVVVVVGALVGVAEVLPLPDAGVAVAEGVGEVPRGVEEGVFSAVRSSSRFPLLLVDFVNDDDPDGCSFSEAGFAMLPSTEMVGVREADSMGCCCFAASPS